MQLLDLLLQPSTYPHATDKIELKQTHASYIFIAIPYVYKIKKSVNFGFLDFSTLKKRKLYCIKEIYLNQKLSENIYLNLIGFKYINQKIVFENIADATHIKKNPGKIFLEIDDRDYIEYAIQMNYIKDVYFLKNQTITKEKLDLITKKLYDFYKNSRIISNDKNQKCIYDNLNETKNFIDYTIHPTIFRFINKFNKFYFKKFKNIFKYRKEEGWIKDCHGDLHLEHIIINKNQVSIYDCIEFNKEFRQIDIANDIAFLCMDLDFYGHYEESLYFLKKMKNLLNDKYLIFLQDIFRCYRSVVRGKVHSLKALSKNLLDNEKNQSLQIAQKYFALSFKYVLTDIYPTILIFMGRIGSGKSTMAKEISKLIGSSVFSSDEIRKKLFQLPLYENTPKKIKPIVYSSFITNIVYNKMLDMAIEEAQKKGISIIDGTFASRKLRNIAVFKTYVQNVDILFIEIDTTKEIVINRLIKRKESQNEISDAGISEYLQFYDSYQPPIEIPKYQRIRVEIKKERDIERTVNFLLKKILLHRIQYKKFTI